MNNSFCFSECFQPTPGAPVAVTVEKSRSIRGEVQDSFLPRAEGEDSCLPSPLGSKARNRHTSDARCKTHTNRLRPPRQPHLGSLLVHERPRLRTGKRKNVTSCSPASLGMQEMPNAMDAENQVDPVIVSINGLHAS
jgi:hypothetical protein